MKTLFSIFSAAVLFAACTTTEEVTMPDSTNGETIEGDTLLQETDGYKTTVTDGYNTTVTDLPGIEDDTANGGRQRDSLRKNDR